MLDHGLLLLIEGMLIGEEATLTPRWHYKSDQSTVDRAIVVPSFYGELRQQMIAHNADSKASINQPAILRTQSAIPFIARINIHPGRLSSIPSPKHLIYLTGN